LKQYCENRVKQINTLYGQNEFIIRLVVLIDATVLYKEMCDILKADYVRQMARLISFTSTYKFRKQSQRILRTVGPYM